MNKRHLEILDSYSRRYKEITRMYIGEGGGEWVCFSCRQGNVAGRVGDAYRIQGFLEPWMDSVAQRHKTVWERYHVHPDDGVARPMNVRSQGEILTAVATLGHALPFSEVRHSDERIEYVMDEVSASRGWGTSWVASTRRCLPR
jgi:hypothetical protein